MQMGLQKRGRKRLKVFFESRRLPNQHVSPSSVTLGEQPFNSKLVTMVMNGHIIHPQEKTEYTISILWLSKHKKR